MPSQSEIKTHLGGELTKVVLDHSHNEIKKYLGLSPPRVGPGKEVWISPSDQLLEKSNLKQPVHSNQIKACTHDGILKIGEQALEKYRQDIEVRMKSKLYEDLVDEKNMSKAEKRRAVEVALQKTKERYKNCVLQLKCRFKKKFEIELEKATTECERKMQEAILQERADITRGMITKMRDEIGFVVTSLYHHFESNLCKEKLNMIAEFNQIMRRDRLKTDALMREMIRRKEEEFESTLKELELQKIVDLVYVLCSERMRCCSEKEEIHDSFEKQIEVLQKMLLEGNRQNEPIKEDSFQNENETTKIIEIVKQFQKFINFAFGAVPGQADFFLSLESLLKLELDQNESVTEKNQNRKKIFNIFGDDVKDCLQTSEEFTISRMQSLKRILKQHPSLKHILIPHIGKALY